ncbi:MAG: amino acid racemase [Anaerocolumna sp.]|nr:amino acid racemase [Anaerocolumna sp.]
MREYNNSKDKSRAWLEIDINNLKHNAEVLQEIMPDNCKLMAVVKANAYGHGDIETAAVLNSIGIHSFAVATIDEGIRLRRNNIKGEILVLGYTDVSRAKELATFDLMQTVIDYSYGIELSKQGYNLSVHIKIDTGMHRLGFGEEEYRKAAEIFDLTELTVEGIFTHLCVAESNNEVDIDFTNRQIATFYGFLEKLKHLGINLPKVHIQSSYGLLNYPELQCDYARIGIALYGSYSSIHDKCKITPDLRPVLSLKAKIALTKTLNPGESLSYGRTFTATKATKIAILPIGYGDGLPRNLSNGGACVILQGKKVPIIGRICMDQLIVDITDLNTVQRGGIATIIGKEKGVEILAAEVAGEGDSIANELLSRLGSRLNRIYQ